MKPINKQQHYAQKIKDDLSAVKPKEIELSWEGIRTSWNQSGFDGVWRKIKAYIDECISGNNKRANYFSEISDKVISNTQDALKGDKGPEVTDKEIAEGIVSGLLEGMSEIPEADMAEALKFDLLINTMGNICNEMAEPRTERVKELGEYVSSALKNEGGHKFGKDFKGLLEQCEADDWAWVSRKLETEADMEPGGADVESLVADLDAKIGGIIIAGMLATNTTGVYSRELNGVTMAKVKKEIKNVFEQKLHNEDELLKLVEEVRKIKDYNIEKEITDVIDNMWESGQIAKETYNKLRMSRIENLFEDSDEEL